MVSYTEKKFRKMSSANKFASSMTKQYGYRPTVFSVRKPGATSKVYVVVKPKGLKRLR